MVERDFQVSASGESCEDLVRQTQCAGFCPGEPWSRDLPNNSCGPATMPGALFCDVTLELFSQTRHRMSRITMAWNSLTCNEKSMELWKDWPCLWVSRYFLGQGQLSNQVSNLTQEFSLTKIILNSVSANFPSKTTTKQPEKTEEKWAHYTYS